MATNIDTNIVEMQFNNARFERNVQQTIDSLEQLKKGLELDKSAKSLANLEKSVKGLDFGEVTKSVDAIANRFTTLGIVGTTALMNITNSAVNMGKRLISSLSVDQVTAGWDKYADKTAAVQTIMAATAKDFDDTGKQMTYVNSQLDKLNWFTDETSYNFLDMVSNIGKFTSNNIKLDKSVTAMQGIASWAAISGANANEASRAMYNLSQAIAVGSVKLIDWKSIENANMATAQFKETVIDTAVAMGTLKKQSDGTYKTLKGHTVTVSNFNEALSDAWFTSDVLLATLDKYGGFTDELYEASEKTGLSATRLLENISAYKDGTLDMSEIVAETGLSADVLTSIFDKLTNETVALGEKSFRAAQEAKTLTEAINATKDAVSTGWMKSFEIIFGDYEEAKKLWTGVANQLYEIFAASGEARNEMLSEWKELGGRNIFLQSFRNILEGIYSITGPINEAFRNMFPAMTGKRLYDLTVKFEEFTRNLIIGDEASDKLRRTFSGLFSILNIGKKSVGLFVDILGGVIKRISPMGMGVLDLTAKIGDLLVAFDKFLSEGNVFERASKKFEDGLKPFDVGISFVISKVKSGFDSLKNIDLSGIDIFGDRVSKRAEPLKKIGDLATVGISKIVSETQKLAPEFANVGNSFLKIVDKLISTLSRFNYSTVLDLFNSGMFAAILVAFRKFSDSLGKIAGNSEKMLGSIKGILKGTQESLEAFTGAIKAETLKKISISIGILAASLIALSFVDSEKLTPSLGAISVLFIALTKSMNSLSATLQGRGFARITAISGVLISLSVAMLILTGAVSKLAGQDWEGLLRGVSGVSAASLILVKSANSLSVESNHLRSTAIGLVIFSSAVKVLVSAIDKLGGLNLTSLTKGLVGVGALCLELAIFLRLADLDNMGVRKGVGLLALAEALKVLQASVAGFSIIDSEGLKKGLFAVGIVLVELSAFLKMTSGTKSMIMQSVGLIILAEAMSKFSAVVSSFGSLPVDVIENGLLTLAGALSILVLALNLMPKGVIATGTGLVIVAQSIRMLIDPIKDIGGMSLEEIGKSLITLAGAFTIFAVGLTAMKGSLGASTSILILSSALSIFVPVLKSLSQMSIGEIIKSLLTLVGTFALFAGSALILSPLVPTMLGLAGAITLLGAGTLAAGIGILALSTGLTALSVGGTAAAAALTLMVSSLIGLIPLFVEEIGRGIIAIVGILAEGSPEIIQGAIAIFSALLTAVKAVGPDLIATFVGLVVVLANELKESSDDLIDAGLVIILNLLKGIRDNIGEFVDVGFEIIANLLKAILSKVLDLAKAGRESSSVFISAMISEIKKLTSSLLTSVRELAYKVISGLVRGIAEKIGDVGRAMSNLGDKMISSIKHVLGIKSPSDEMEYVGEMTGEGVAVGLKKSEGSVLKIISEMSSNMLNRVVDELGIHSPSSVFNEEVGQEIVNDIAAGIKANKSAEKAAETKAKAISDAFKKQLDKIDMNINTTSLEYDLWAAVHGATATDSEKSAAEMATISKKMVDQANKVRLAQEEYKITLEEFGETSTETQQAYNKFLQEQIDLQNLSNDLSSKQAEIAQQQTESLNQQKEAQKQYNDFMQESAAGLLKAGYSLDRIEEYGRKLTGYDPEKMLEFNQQSLAKTVNKSADTIGSSWSTAADKTSKELNTDYKDMGSQAAMALSKGMYTNMDLPVDRTTDIAENCADVLENQVPVWNNGGGEMAKSLAAGIVANSPAITNAATDAAQNAYKAAMATLGGGTSAAAKLAQNGSKEAGQTIVKKFAEGISEDYAIYAITGEISENMLKEAVNYADMINRVVADKVEGYQPTIRPVVDMDNVEGTLDQIDKYVKHATSASGVLGTSGRISQDITSRGVIGLLGGRSYASVGSQASDSGSGGTTISFTQNNYSPKAISASETYRNTSNQLSSFANSVKSDSSGKVSQDLGGRASGNWNK